MKSALNFILLIVLITVSVIVPISIAKHLNSPSTENTGSHDPVLLTSNSKITLEGTYSFKSSAYFELRQDGRPPIQAILEAPAEGEEYGLYWIRDLTMSGTWTNVGGSEVFSSQSNTVTVEPSGLNKFLNWVMAVILIIVFMFLSMVIVTWIEYRL